MAYMHILAYTKAYIGTANISNIGHRSAYIYIVETSCSVDQPDWHALGEVNVQT